MFWLFDSVQNGAEVFAVGCYNTDVIYSLYSVSNTYDQLQEAESLHRMFLMQALLAISTRDSSGIVKRQ